MSAVPMETEQAVDARGLVEMAPGYFADPETGEIFCESATEALDDHAAKTGCLWIRGCDRELEMAEAKAKHWAGRARALKARRETLLSWFGAAIKRVADAVRVKNSSIVGCAEVVYSKSRGSVEVVDTELALAWLRANCPEAIVTKEVIQVSRLTEDAREWLYSAPGASAEIVGFEAEPPGVERWKLRTGGE